MVAYPGRLPSRFPEGTKYVVEGRSGGGFSRYLEFPDGTQLRLPVRPAKAGAAGSGGRRNRAPSRRR
jgi:hypothetical protein